MCALLSALLVSKVVKANEILDSLASEVLDVLPPLAPPIRPSGSFVECVLKWMSMHLENCGVMLQAVCLLANLVAAARDEHATSKEEGRAARLRQHREEEERAMYVCERLVRSGAISCVVKVQRRWAEQAAVTAESLRFFCSLAAVPAPCNAAFGGPQQALQHANAPATPARPATARASPKSGGTLSLPRSNKATHEQQHAQEPQPQRANYLLADDVRKTGIHDAILAAVKRHQHPLMRECALLHHLVAAPTWGQRTLTRSDSIKTYRVLGYASTTTAARAAASALTAVTCSRPHFRGAAPGEIDAAAMARKNGMNFGKLGPPPISSLDNRLRDQPLELM